MIEPVGENTECEGLHAVDGLLAILAVGEDAGKFRHLRDPAAVRFLFDLDSQWHLKSSA